MHTVCIIQARMGSSRLPGKVMKPLAGKPALWHVVDRAGRCRLIDEIVIASTTEPADQRIVDYCKDQGWNVTRGSESDVLERYHQTAIAYAADIVIRITSDCPLIDPGILTRLIREFTAGDVDYMSTNYPSRTFPVGCDCEIMTVEALDRAHKEATAPYDREHVTPYLYTNPDRFRVAGIIDDQNHANVRLTLDTAQDYDLLAAIYERYYRPGEIVKLSDAVMFYVDANDVSNA
ncbi:MAG: glycosyltransferase family protein [Rhizobiales bacterium]|nr:glycosyltransferase family protein [Hyphomicrobiales bacterium]